MPWGLAGSSEPRPTELGHYRQFKVLAARRRRTAAVAWWNKPDAAELLDLTAAAGMAARRHKRHKTTG
jgi:hypothetical protein